MHLSKMHISTGICRNSKAGIWTYLVVVGGAAESTNLAAPRRRDRARARRMVPSFTPCGGKPYCCRHLASACVLLRAKSVQNPCQNLLTHTRRHTVFTVKETRFFAQGGLTAGSRERGAQPDRFLRLGVGGFFRRRAPLNETRAPVHSQGSSQGGQQTGPVHTFTRHADVRRAVHSEDFSDPNTKITYDLSTRITRV